LRFLGVLQHVHLIFRPCNSFYYATYRADFWGLCFLENRFLGFFEVCESFSPLFKGCLLVFGK